MRNLMFGILLTSCVCASEQPLTELCKNYYLSVLRYDGREERIVSTSLMASKLYGFTLREIRQSPFLYQEGTNFEDNLRRMIEFEVKKGRFLRAVLLVAIAGDLDIDVCFRGTSLVRAYVEARFCTKCGKWVFGPWAYRCCRCTAKVHPRCTLKEGHEGNHRFDIELGPIPSRDEMHLIPYGP